MLWEKFTPGRFNAGRVLGVECRGLLVVFIVFSMLIVVLMDGFSLTSFEAFFAL
jgi:hypothetical protein